MGRWRNQNIHSTSIGEHQIQLCTYVIIGLICYVHVCMCVCTRACVYACVSVYVCVCVCMFRLLGWEVLGFNFFACHAHF